jgi:hypothetical protein
MHHKSKIPLKAVHALPARLSKRQKWAVYLIIAILWITGVAWLIAHYYLRNPDDFAALIHPIEPWSMKLHGAAAILFAALFGALSKHHMRLNWRREHNRLSAVFLLAIVGLLMTTGYLLYYANGEVLRAFSSKLHWILGLLTALVVGLHVYIGQKSRS